MQYRRKDFYTVAKKTQLKEYILSTVLPNTGNPLIMNVQEILVELRKLKAFNDLKVSEIMVLQALEELRVAGSLLRDDDGWAYTPPA